MKLLLVDGSNLLFQMFYGMPARIANADGKLIHGTLGFVGALLKIIRMTDPTHVIVLFDGERGSDRSDLDENYKQNRPDFTDVPEEENPFSQLADIYSALDFLGIVHTESECCEADDLIAAYALTYGGGHDIVISSFDSDFWQLVTDRVRVLRYRGDKTVVCDREYIKARCGVVPERYADFKSLVGDTADNIKGAEKIGPNTAAALIGEFGTLDNILANADTIKKPSVRDSIKQSVDRLRLNYRLIKLENKVPLPFSMDVLGYSYSGVTTTEVLKAIGLK